METEQFPGMRDPTVDGNIPSYMTGADSAPERRIPDRSIEAERPGSSGRARFNGRLTRRRLGWSAAAAVVLALIGLSLRPAPVDVEAAQVGHGPLEVTVDAEGVTRLHDRFQVFAPVTGRVERIMVREGDPVVVGTLLARIAPLPLDPQGAAQARARVAAALAGADEADARAAQAAAALDQTERSTERIRVVAEAGGMSIDAVERAELQLATALREHQAARSRVRLARAEVAAAQTALVAVDPQRSAVAELRSPGAGRVLRVHERSERVLAAGTPLVDVGDASALEVVVDVLSTDAVRIPAGAAVRLVEWGGEGAVQGRVRLVEPSGFTKVSALGVEEQRVNALIDLMDPPAALGDGYRIEARIVTWDDPQVLKVPNSALFRSGSEWQLFVVANGRAHRRAVRVGHRGAAEAQVLDGLRQGETVVLFPSDRLQDGARVRAR